MKRALGRAEKDRNSSASRAATTRSPLAFLTRGKKKNLRQKGKTKGSATIISERKKKGASTVSFARREKEAGRGVCPECHRTGPGSKAGKKKRGASQNGGEKNSRSA